MKENRLIPDTSRHRGSRAGILWACAYALLVPALFIVGGCADSDHSPAAGEPTHVVDDLGRSVELKLPVSRVASLAPSVTEVVVAASGSTDLLVGVTSADDFPPEVAAIPSYSAIPVNFEAIVALDPELVLATTQVNNPADAELLAEAGIPTFFLAAGSMQAIVSNIRLTGRLLGTEEEAERAAVQIETRLEELNRLGERTLERPSVLFLLSSDNLYSFGSGSFMNDVIELAGGRSISADLPTAAPILSEEFVVSESPDVIVGTFPEGTSTEEFLLHHPSWHSIPAIVNQRIHALDPDLLLRGGPRTVEGAWEMLRAVHPELEIESTN